MILLYSGSVRRFIKIGKAVFILLIIVVVILSLVLERNSRSQEVKFGVTFSSHYAKYLKLDWQKTYLQTLDDLKIRNFRVPSYWDILEPELDRYDFSEVDFMLNEAGKRGAKVILVVGARQPRWPECHIPVWAKKLNISDRQQQTLEFIQKVVERYQDYPSVWAWQVENEPLLWYFGKGCDAFDNKFLQKEVALIRSLSNKPAIVTDSGELGSWIIPMQFSDIFGTTLYRKVYDKYLGYITYPLPPYFYSLKSRLVKNIFAPGNQKTIVVEFQSEPWLANGNFVPVAGQSQLFTIDQFKNYTNFAQKTGFEEVYLWGAEWWYFMAANGYPEYLEYAKSLFR